MDEQRVPDLEQIGEREAYSFLEQMMSDLSAYSGYELAMTTS